MDLLECACASALFRGIARDAAESLLCRLNAAHRTVRRGEFVAHAGLEAGRIVAVVSGRLLVYGGVDGGTETLMREICAGDAFGLVALNIPEMSRWPCSAIASEDSETLLLGIKETRQVLASGESAVCRMSANISSILARETLSAWRRLEVLGEPKLESRVMAYLSGLADGGEGEVAVPFDRERMASYLGVTRPALSRALGRLRDRGIVKWRKNLFRICGG